MQKCAAFLYLRFHKKYLKSDKVLQLCGNPYYGRIKMKGGGYMEHITVGRKYSEGKVAFAECVKNGLLEGIDIKNQCFLLILLTNGRLTFTVGGKRITAAAPAFLCFDESENPVFASKGRAQYTCIYFHPQFLNINMTFTLLRSDRYTDIASTHDMFLLKPFIDKVYCIPICETQLEKIVRAADSMQKELAEQRDWYWSCRSRSYFMEIMIALERLYGLIDSETGHPKVDNSPTLENPRLRDAVLYIEGHYSENIRLSDISASACINHTTLTALMKKALGCTAIEYLTNYRIGVAKKQLAFTDVPIKEIAAMTGFKTVPHFSRIFKEHTDTTPAAFRKTAVQKRKDEI